MTRCTGKTYRLCLYSALKCSEQENLTIFINCLTLGNRCLIRHYLSSILHPIQSYMTRREIDEFYFKNGSKIILRNEVQTEELRGIKEYTIYTDFIYY